MMPRATKTPVPDTEMDAVWQGLIEGLKTPRDRRLAYVHVPFCTNHCLFCGFYRHRHRRRDGGSAAFADLVVEEVRHEAQAPGIATRPLQAVYLGGGTPTALAPSTSNASTNLLRALNEICTRLSDAAENDCRE